MHKVLITLIFTFTLAFGAYLIYMKNYSVKKVDENYFRGTINEVPSVSATPSFSEKSKAQQIHKEPGYNVYNDEFVYINTDGSVDVLISKDRLLQLANQEVPDYKSNTGTKMFKVHTFELDAKGTKAIVLVRGSITPFYTYYYDMTMDTVRFIDYAQEVEWSPTSTHVAYTKLPADIGPAALFIYEVENNDNFNVERENPEHCIMSYSKVSWVDSQTIQAYYIGSSCPFDNIGKIDGEGYTQFEVL